MKSIYEMLRILRELAIRKTLAGVHCEVVTSYIAPTLHIDFISDYFLAVDVDSRLSCLHAWMLELNSALPVGLFDDMMGALPLTINVLHSQEAKFKREWMKHSVQHDWVSAFLGNNAPIPAAPEAHSDTKIVHFYGYKGGQARSSVLALLAKVLADDGHRILVIDADAEAPSLDNLFNVSADRFSQTLMGACGWARELAPLPAIYSGRRGGQVDLLPCRPKGEDFDLDFALFVATTPIDSRIYERAAEAIKSYISSCQDQYDVVLVDHRTGIASSVLPLISSLSGTAAIFVRNDSNLAVIPSELRRIVHTIFSRADAVPGVFVSFSLDPNRSSSAELSDSEARARELLLSELAEIVERSSSDSDRVPGSELVSSTDLSFNWIEWYLDRAMMTSTLPDVDRLQSDNLGSLRLLREALALPLGRRRVTVSQLSNAMSEAVPVSSLSGAKDSGQFIHIPELDRLFVIGNPYSYILGRKGTGKTRLLKEMAKRGLGHPLLVANDETSMPGLRSQSIEANAWLERCEFDAPTFWWSLLRIRLENVAYPDQTVSHAIGSALRSNVAVKELADKVKIKDLILSLDEPLVLLVDGLETLVPAAKIKSFVIALFDLLSTIQNDPALTSKIVIRAFIREDLAADSVQNIEQQLEGRSIRLRWSATSILNFALSRLPLLRWIGEQFKEVCQEIKDHRPEIERSAFSEQRATDLMLRIFPARLRRNNLSTATFLRLYFSDTGGDDTNKGTFYPRLYLSFLQKLDSLAEGANSPLNQDGRIDSGLLNRAYDEASNEFIEETKQELAHLLALEYSHESDEDDSTKVSKFIAAFAGLSTPFLRDVIVSELSAKTNFTDKSVRESLQRMKAIRMFEDRPGYGGWWRVGQLYKMGLMMKYVRGPASGM